MVNSVIGYGKAINDFRTARQRAVVEQLLARLQGRSDELLSYQDVSRGLQITNSRERGLQEIPVAAIVGSVGRYNDFTRTFLPRLDATEGRWARVKAVMTDGSGTPPIEVYQLGDAFFVKDGNHRVSIARQMGTPTIPAYVTEVKTRVPLSKDDNPDALINKARYAEFLARTNIDNLRPDVDLRMSTCDQYTRLAEHIDVHQYYMGLDEKRDVPYDEAVGHWYDHVYRPVVDLVDQLGMLRHFPGQTPTDLYMLVTEHREDLAVWLGWSVQTNQAVTDLVRTKSPTTGNVLDRLGSRLLDTLTPDELETGPAPGAWRERRGEPIHTDRIFADILVAARDSDVDPGLLDHALAIAQREEGRLLGLHVVKSESDVDSAEIEGLRRTFIDRCEAAGVAYGYALETGSIARRIVDRAAWSDLVVLNLAHPPGAGVLAQIGSGFNKILQRSPTPVLAVPSGAPSSLKRALLAFDGSPRSREALFVAAYVGARWQIDLDVVAVGKETATAGALDEAWSYLDEHGVAAGYVAREGKASAHILGVAADLGSDLLIVGGFGVTPLTRIVVGSTVSSLLRESRLPLLICR